MAIFVLTALTASCGNPSLVVGPVLPDSYDVDPVFREYLDMLGGENVLGPAISPLFERNSIRYQYTLNGLMVQDPQAPSGQSYFLAPLGLEMGIAEPPVVPPDSPNARYVDGHVIGDIFAPLYDRLGGKRVTGKPLTEMHFNPELGRFEQYFENLGMYWQENAPPGEVQLLAYGAWKCGASCSKYPIGSGVVALYERIGDMFLDAVSRLGVDFTNRALTKPYQLPDGYTEQVFGNMVLVSDPANPGQVFTRPITLDTGNQADPSSDPSVLTGYSFVPVQDGKGYNVPQQFLDYLAHHGGMEAAGVPITEFKQVKESLKRQCFTNLCLEERIGTDGIAWIQASPLGYTYKLLPVRPLSPKSPASGIALEQALPSQDPAVQLPTPALPAIPDSPASELTIRVWESYPQVEPNQSQEIGVSVLENNIPVQNLEPVLVVTMPDGSERTYVMYPTGEDGVSRFVLEPIDAPAGTQIPYEVCIVDREFKTYCAIASFLIWQNP